LAGTVIVLAILALVLALVDEIDLIGSERVDGPLLALILASAVTGAGTVLLAWVLSSTSRLSQTSKPTASMPVSDARPDFSGALSRDTTSLMRSLSRSGYWLSSTEGTFEQIDPADDDSQLRLTELLGKHRKSLAADDASRDALASIARQTAARLPYRGILWRCRLPGGQFLNLRESGMPRYDESGQFRGYHGFIEDISAQALDPVRTQLVTQALEVLPIPLALIHYDQDSTNRDGWRLVWANAPMTHLTGRSQIELSDEPLHLWVLCAPGVASDIDKTCADSRRRPGSRQRH